MQCCAIIVNDRPSITSTYTVYMKLSSQLTNFRMPPYCLTVRLALLNFATWAMVSAAKHFSSSLKPRRSFTIVCRPMEWRHKILTLAVHCLPERTENSLNRWLLCMGYWPSLFGQDGWILAKFFFCVSLWTETKGFIIWDKTPTHDKLYLRDKARIPSGQDSSILPARVANHSARFGSSCPLTELVI